MKLTDQARVALLGSILGLALGVASLLGVWTLYRHTLAMQTSRLVLEARAESRLLEVLIAAGGGGAASEQSTIAAVRGIAAGGRTFGETGQVAVGRREGDRIVYVLHRRGEDSICPDPVRCGTEEARAMEAALDGFPGVLFLTDHAGNEVLAAHEPVRGAGLGVVAQIDLREIRAPFVGVAATLAFAELLLLVVAVVAFRKVSVPLLVHLQQAATRYRTLFETSADALFLLSDVVEDSNRRASELLGLKPGGTLGRSFAEFLLPGVENSDLRGVLAAPSALATRAPSRLLPGRMRRADGLAVEIEASVAETVLEDEVLLLVAVRDVSAKVKLERDLRDLNETLERRVAARTAELSETNRDLESFARFVSHDLRAPLRIVDGYAANLLDRGDLPEEARRDLARIRLATARMAGRIAGLLTLSRFTRVIQDREETNLSELAQNVARQYRKREEPSPASVEVAPGMIAVADRRLLEAVIDNLLGNAFKFTDDRDHPRIEVGMSEQDGELVVFVRDNGIGFEQACAERVFRVFERLGASERFEGNGIGLAIVERIVSRHGGRVWAQSNPGCGSTFLFTLGPGGLRRTSTDEVGVRAGS